MTVLVIAILLVLSPLSASPLLYLDTGPDMPRTAAISGAAHASDFVHVWAFPANGAIFVGESLANLPDAVRAQPSGGWSVLAQNLPLGAYPIVVYGHDPITDTFTSQLGRTYTVRACKPPTTEYWTYAGPNGPVVVQLAVCR